MRRSALPDQETVPQHVRDSVETLAQLRAKLEGDVASHQLGIEWFTHRLGRPFVVYGALGFVALWIVLNTYLASSGRHAFDPFPFQVLQGLLTFAALMMTVLILTRATRLGDVADDRARLMLQLVFVTEQKVAKTIELLERLRRDDPHLFEHPDAEASEMSSPIDPLKITEAVDESHRR